MWISYTHSASFINYLVNTYGLEKFELIYNEKELAKKIEEVYEKNISKLEKDWVAFINNQSELTTEEKVKIDNFYGAISVINQIDPKYFTKD